LLSNIHALLVFLSFYSKLKVVLIEVCNLLFNFSLVLNHAVHLTLDHGQLNVLESSDFDMDLLVESEGIHQLSVHVSRSDRLLHLGVRVRDLFLLVHLLAHGHGQVAHLRQGLEVGEERKVLRDVLLFGELVGDFTAVGALATAHLGHHDLDNVRLQLAVVDLPYVLLQVVRAAEERLSLLCVGSSGATSEELGHGVKHEGNNVVVGVFLDETLNGGEVLFVDVFHLLSLSLEQLPLNLH
jgi:hypothetical protein